MVYFEASKAKVFPFENFYFYLFIYLKKKEKKKTVRDLPNFGPDVEGNTTFSFFWGGGGRGAYISDHAYTIDIIKV